MPFVTRCCVRLGYYDDRFVHLLASNHEAPRYPPLINRGWSSSFGHLCIVLRPATGYWSRVSAVRSILIDFVSRCSAVGFGCQIVSLGGGYDTNFFWLKVYVRVFHDYFDKHFSTGFGQASRPVYDGVECLQIRPNESPDVEVDFPVVCQRKEKTISSNAELGEIVGAYTQNLDSWSSSPLLIPAA